MPDKTKEIIAGMLKENTGVHFLDSGGAYGRNWEQNQSRDFEKEKRGGLSFHSGTRTDGTHYGWMDASMNIYHWLTDRLSYSEPMDTLFREVFVELSEPKAMWYELIEDFPNFLSLKDAWKDRKEEIEALMLSKPEWREWWGEEETEWDEATEQDVTTWSISWEWRLGRQVGERWSENTYNHDSYLSQVIQYHLFDWGNEGYIILEIHGGADVRGGYTDPVIFQCDYENLNDSACFVHCQNGHVWDTGYDGYHFRLLDDQGDWNHNDKGKPLDEYEFLDDETYNERLQAQRDEYDREHGPALNYLAQMQAGQAGFQKMPMPDAPNFEAEMPEVIRHDEDGNGYCPICGTLLELDYFQE